MTARFSSAYTHTRIRIVVVIIVPGLRCRPCTRGAKGREGGRGGGKVNNIINTKRSLLVVFVSSSSSSAYRQSLNAIIGPADKCVAHTSGGGFRHTRSRRKGVEHQRNDRFSRLSQRGEGEGRKEECLQISPIREIRARCAFLVTALDIRRDLIATFLIMTLMSDAYRVSGGTRRWRPMRLDFTRLDSTRLDSSRRPSRQRPIRLKSNRISLATTFRFSLFVAVRMPKRISVLFPTRCAPIPIIAHAYVPLIRVPLARAAKRMEKTRLAERRRLTAIPRSVTLCRKGVIPSRRYSQLIVIGQLSLPLYTLFQRLSSTKRAVNRRRRVA